MITSTSAGLETGTENSPPAPAGPSSKRGAVAPASTGTLDAAPDASGRPATRTAVWDGFDVYFLQNPFLELGVVPELGGRIVSLKNSRTGREWMYRPHAGAKLFRNQLGDDFARSPLIGWDECLPTITPCHWQGRALPDHGEVWSAAGRLDEAAWAEGMIRTTVRLPISPLEFIRTVQLQDDTLKVDYQLTNLSGEAQDFLWIMHPLLAFHTGDRLALPAEIRGQLNSQPWIDHLDFGSDPAACAKVFAGPLQEGRAEVVNEISGDRFVLTWDAADCPMLGLWLTRGGWHGHHHLALEPANGMHDSLAVAADQPHGCGRLGPGAKKQWQIRIQLPSAGEPA